MFPQINPMLIANKMEPFNDINWIFELKLDGCRCIAYLDSETSLKNKRNIEMIQKFPELMNLHKYISGPTILDGELIILKNGVPDFFELQRRTLLTDQFKIQLASSRLPASFVAYDCLWFNDDSLLSMPLLDRKEKLDKTVHGENDRFAISRFIENNGIGLYQLADERELEGVIAKKKKSLYFPGKRSKEWIKFKRMEDEDFVVAGYVYKGAHTYSIILSKYQNGNLVYKGHVTSGISKEVVQQLTQTNKSPLNIISIGLQNEKVVWVIADHVCTIEFMPNTKKSLRQPVFKGFRTDMAPENISV